MNPSKEILLKLHFFHKISPKENKYVFLLIAIVMILVVSPFFQESNMARFYFSLLISVVLATSIYADIEIKRIDYLEILLGSLALIFTWLDFFIPDLDILDFLTQLMYSLYFLYFNIELVVKIVLSDKISSNLVYASIVGFLMLGLCGASLASLLQWIINDAYQLPSNVSAHKFENFIYYSFVTITTVGYGDMLPIHPASKMLAIILCIAGHLYTTIVLALIMGKFISNYSLKSQ
ncbi:MAG: potassium channel family protein [Bacteroidota bacterium]|nr:potassium channel family protein [Bacteroidota bacterium]